MRRSPPLRIEPGAQIRRAVPEQRDEEGECVAQSVAYVRGPRPAARSARTEGQPYGRVRSQPIGVHAGVRKQLAEPGIDLRTYRFSIVIGVAAGNVDFLVGIFQVPIGGVFAVRPDVTRRARRRAGNGTGLDLHRASRADEHRIPQSRYQRRLRSPDRGPDRAGRAVDDTVPDVFRAFERHQSSSRQLRPMSQGPGDVLLRVAGAETQRFAGGAVPDDVAATSERDQIPVQRQLVVMGGCPQPLRQQQQGLQRGGLAGRVVPGQHRQRGARELKCFEALEVFQRYRSDHEGVSSGPRVG